MVAGLPVFPSLDGIFKKLEKRRLCTNMITRNTELDALWEHAGMSGAGAWGEDEKYLEYVDIAMRERHNMVFSNSSPRHAVYLIYKFFLCARREMRIFSGKLARREANPSSADENTDVYADKRVLAAVGEFLADEGTSLKIVVQHGLDGDAGNIGDHPLVKKVRELEDDNRLRGSCEIAKLDPSLRQQLEEEGRLYHVMIMDRSAYRLETDTGKTKAHVNVNDNATAKELIQFFDDSLWAGASPLWSAPSVANKVSP